jgi:hypothetical protein
MEIKWGAEGKGVARKTFGGAQPLQPQKISSDPSTKLLDVSQMASCSISTKALDVDVDVNDPNTLKKSFLGELEL